MLPYSSHKRLSNHGCIRRPQCEAFCILYVSFQEHEYLTTIALTTDLCVLAQARPNNIGSKLKIVQNFLFKGTG